ncbi:MAG TPA: lysylphosphatidylglycerol synthase transmembrane domain-containing protein [Candidatus Eisenbacteria bacterium]
MTRSRLLLSALGIGLSGAAVVALLRQTDLAILGRELRGARLEWLFLAGAVTLAGYDLRARRWGVLLSPRARVPQSRLFGATMVGFLAINTLPARIGELARAYVLSRTERVPVGAVLGSVVMERLFDLVALGTFWALSLLFAPYPDWFRWSGYLTLALGVVLVGGVWALHAAHASEHPVLDRLLSLAPSRVRDRLGSGVASFTSGLSGIRDPGTLIRAGAWSAAMWVVNAAVFLLVGESMGLHLPGWSPLLLTFVVCVAILLPSSPGFIGVLEAGCVVGLGLVGVGESRALAYGILYHLTQLLPLILMGSFYAFRGHLGPDVLSGDGVPTAPRERKTRRH